MARLKPSSACDVLCASFGAVDHAKLRKRRSVGENEFCRADYLGFQEVFPDEGDVDMFAAIKAYRRGGYAGPLCPDHVPVSELDEGRERFMSFALGHTRGLLQAAGVWSTPRH